MLRFEDKHFTVQFKDQTATLQPLSYRLLKALAVAPGEILSAEHLMQQVWPDTTVSPDTLKQRAFLLRKSLQDAGLGEVEISSIRGEGYRLFTQDTPTLTGKWSSAKKYLSITAAVITLFLAFWFWPDPATPVSNRVSVWQVSGEQGTRTYEAEALHESWQTVVLEAGSKGSIQYIATERDNSLSISQQARRDRVALISIVKDTVSNGLPAVRLQIIEPHTSTILKNSLITLSDGLDDSLDQSDSYKAVLNAHLVAIETLVSSGKLVLSKDQKTNAQDPIWSELKRLANN